MGYILLIHLCYKYRLLHIVIKWCGHRELVLDPTKPQTVSHAAGHQAKRDSVNSNRRGLDLGNTPIANNISDLSYAHVKRGVGSDYQRMGKCYAIAVSSMNIEHVSVDCRRVYK